MQSWLHALDKLLDFLARNPHTPTEKWVVVGVATVTMPPVKLTLVTLPLPLLLNVVQSVELNAPRLDAEAVGTCSVITGVVVPFATVLDRSVPVVPSVSAATLVTVPEPPPAAVNTPLTMLRPLRVNTTGAPVPLSRPSTPAVIVKPLEPIAPVAALPSPKSHW
jgi:hypothetical protein